MQGTSEKYFIINFKKSIVYYQKNIKIIENVVNLWYNRLVNEE